MIDLSVIGNPVLRRTENLRDPAVLPRADGTYLVYFTVFNCPTEDVLKEWFTAANWSVGMAVTGDFVDFHDFQRITPENHASPGDPVFWHGRYILPYQTYPEGTNWLCFSESGDGIEWSAPQRFLAQANGLAWNTRKRAIDPTLVVEGDWLHCFFVGGGEGLVPGTKANLLGHAVSRDPELADWHILSVAQPLIGASPSAPDGVENLAVLHDGQQWVMVYSEGLENQHLACATSPDLRQWTLQGAIAVPLQSWLSFRHGAPAIWRDGDQWLMLLMGEEDASHRSTLGLLHSVNLRDWIACPEHVEQLMHQH
jgi:hypothetical protein